MDTYDRWIGESCSGITFCKHKIKTSYRDGTKRSALIKKYNDRAWPFCHGLVLIEAPWFTHRGWGLDPLVIPLLHRLHEIPGFKGISSCQGNHHFSPYVLFSGSLEVAQEALALTRNQNGPYFNDPILALCGAWDGETFWNLSLYDTLSLISLNERLGTPIKRQIESYFHDVKSKFQRRTPLVSESEILEALSLP